MQITRKSTVFHIAIVVCRPLKTKPILNQPGPAGSRKPQAHRTVRMVMLAIDVVRYAHHALQAFIDVMYDWHE